MLSDVRVLCVQPFPALDGDGVGDESVQGSDGHEVEAAGLLWKNPSVSVIAGSSSFLPILKTSFTENCNCDELFVYAGSGDHRSFRKIRHLRDDGGSVLSKFELESKQTVVLAKLYDQR